MSDQVQIHLSVYGFGAIARRPERDRDIIRVLDVAGERDGRNARTYLRVFLDRISRDPRVVHVGRKLFQIEVAGLSPDARQVQGMSWTVGDVFDEIAVVD